MKHRLLTHIKCIQLRKWIAETLSTVSINAGSEPTPESFQQEDFAVLRGGFAFVWGGLTL